MKKKSLLILPVLLLALAACNKEEDVEVPDENDSVTENEDADDTTKTEDEKEDEKELIDTRIILATKSVDFGVNAGFVNPEALSIAETTVDDEGNVTYVLDGTPSTMNEGQANVFWEGVAADGDAYIVITIEVKDGETVSWLASDGQEKSYTYEECEGEVSVVIRISGICLSNEIPMGRAVYTISNETAGTSVTHTVDFSSIIELPSRVTLSTWSGSLRGESFTYANPESGLYIDSVAVDELGNVTYYVKGTASTMTASGQGSDFGGQATDNDAYIIVTLSLNADETASWLYTDDGSTEQTRNHPANPESGGETEDVDIIIRISGSGLTNEVKGGLKVFTISTGEADAAVGVTHTVDFSAVTNSAAATSATGGDQ